MILQSGAIISLLSKMKPLLLEIEGGARQFYKSRKRSLLGRPFPCFLLEVVQLCLDVNVLTGDGTAEHAGPSRLDVGTEEGIHFVSGMGRVLHDAGIHRQIFVVFVIQFRADQMGRRTRAVVFVIPGGGFRAGQEFQQFLCGLGVVAG